MENGDFVEIDFVGRVKGTGEVFDITSADEAKRLGVFNEKAKYSPAFAVVGAKMVLPSVEKKLLEMGVGEEKSFELSPEEGFGQRDPGLVKVVSIAKFFEKKINPYPGLFVDIGGLACRVQSVSGGRVRVDFNHPLAGRYLEYRVKILRRIEDAKEKTEKILEYSGATAVVSVDGKKLKIKMEKEEEKTEKFLSETIKKWVKEIETVGFEYTEANKTEGKEESAESE